MTVSAQNLVWIDMEMTGLDPEENVVLEIATIVTDKDLNVLAEGPVIAIHQSDEELAKMDEWNVNTHTKSGLVARVKASQHDEAKAIAETLDFIRQWVPELAGLNKRDIHDPSAMGGLFGIAEYPRPIVDLARSRERALQAFKNLPSAEMSDV